MRATILIDNLPTDGFICEWGLAIHIEYQGKNYLLDSGSTGDFTKNAEILGIDLAKVDAGVLSHAHYDHSDGIPAFFAVNDHAKFHLRKNSAPNCYDRKQFKHNRYIGIKKTLLTDYKDRIAMVSGDYKLDEGVWLIPHKTPGLEKMGLKNGMYLRKNHKWVLDNYEHEQSLVFETEKGLVIFNSCSHGGADAIIREIKQTFPNQKIHAIIGGFHLYKSSDDFIRSLAKSMLDTGVELAVTGHCTGDHAYEVLKEEMGDRVRQMHTGMVIEI